MNPSTAASGAAPVRYACSARATTSRGFSSFHIERERQHRVEQAPRTGVHRVLKLPETWQCVLDERLETVECFGSIEGPAEVAGRRLTETAHARRNDLMPQRPMIVMRTPVGRFRGRAGPRVAVFGIVIPLPACRSAFRVEQYAMPYAHGPVKAVHDP